MTWLDSKSIFWAPLSPFRCGVAPSFQIVLVRIAVLGFVSLAIFVLTLIVHLITQMLPTKWSELIGIAALVLLIAGIGISVSSSHKHTHYMLDTLRVSFRSIWYRTYMVETRTLQNEKLEDHFTRTFTVMLDNLRSERKSIENMRIELLESLNNAQKALNEFRYLLSAFQNERKNFENLRADLSEIPEKISVFLDDTGKIIARCESSSHSYEIINNIVKLVTSQHISPELIDELEQRVSSLSPKDKKNVLSFLVDIATEPWAGALLKVIARIASG